MSNASDFVIENGVFVKYKGRDENVTIPEGVTSIGDWAFYWCKKLRNIIISDGVTEIGKSAFDGCINLENVTIPGSVTKIGSGAFFGCKNLEGITVPDSVTEIGDGAFYDCKNLRSIIIPDGVTVIGKCAFYDCKKLKSITLPDSVTEIGESAFNGCEKLIDKNGFSIVRNVLYSYFGNDKNVVIPEGVTSIGDWAFCDCKNPESITIPGSVTKIGERAFCDCKNLRSITIPDGVTEIGYNAFGGCTNLEKITFSGEIKSISAKAFQGCPLSTLIAPTVPTEIFKKSDLMPVAAMSFLRNRELFTDADIIREYEKYITSQRKRLLPRIFMDDATDLLSFLAGQGKITVKNFEEEYLIPAQEAKASECIAYLLDWKNKNITSEQEERQIEREFNKDPFNVADMKKLWSYEKLRDGSLVIMGYKDDSTEVIIPGRIGNNPVVEIATNAFSPKKKGRLSKQAEVLKKISSIIITEGVIKIGGSAFRSCESLHSVTLPDGMKIIGGSAFSFCKSLEEITIPDSVTIIGDLAFNACPNLTIHAPSGSFAEEYAKENDIPFVAI